MAQPRFNISGFIIAQSTTWAAENESVRQQVKFLVFSQSFHKPASFAWSGAASTAYAESFSHAQGHPPGNGRRASPNESPRLPPLNEALPELFAASACWAGCLEEEDLHASIRRWLPALARRFKPSHAAQYHLLRLQAEAYETGAAALAELLAGLPAKGE